MGILKADQIGATADSFPLFRCPVCHESGFIDDDQFHGRVSIQCPTIDRCDEHGCTYHETKDWSGSK